MIYIMGGNEKKIEEDEVIMLNSIELFDIKNGVLVQDYIKVLPEKLSRFGLIEYDSKILIIGGMLENNVISDKVYVFNPYSNSDDKTFILFSNLPVGLCDMGVVVYDGSLLVIGGLKENNEVSNDIYHFDKKKQKFVKSRDNLKQKRKNFATSLYKDNIYLIGGSDFNNDKQEDIIIETIEKYSKKYGWETYGRNIIPRDGVRSIFFNESIYLFGGSIYNDFLSIVECGKDIDHKKSNIWIGWILILVLCVVFIAGCCILLFVVLTIRNYRDKKMYKELN